MLSRTFGIWLVVGCWTAGTLPLEAQDQASQESNSELAKPVVGAERRPQEDAELKFWLQNMVWFHRFNHAEMMAATGMSRRELSRALRKFRIERDNGPDLSQSKHLLVKPYPGGRHPRIGFRDGTIRPQRETKFSVFLPWETGSYVVVDLPEALWSNLGLTYLAHTHIDTIWTKQNKQLEQLEWKRGESGALDLTRELPNGIKYSAKVRPQQDYVWMELELTNGTTMRLSDLRVQNCVMLREAAGFRAQSNDNKLLTKPYAACQSGNRWIITAWSPCHRPWANPRCPCLHSDPRFADCEPGETKRVVGWLSFYEGDDIKAELRRIDELGWAEWELK